MNDKKLTKKVDKKLNEIKSGRKGGPKNLKKRTHRKLTLTPVGD